MLPDESLIFSLQNQYDQKRVEAILHQFTTAQASMAGRTLLCVMGARPFEIGINTPEASACRLTVFVPEEELAISKVIDIGEYLIGRDSDYCTICLNSQFISRKHALVTVHTDRVVIRDLASRNGTYVDGHRLPHDSQLEIENKPVGISSIILLFQLMR